MPLTSHDLGNDRTAVTGYEERNGLYVALTLTASQWFKTEEQCVGWLARRGYNPDGTLTPCQWPEHWPIHGSMRACGEGDCYRCSMEQEHGESHEGEPCPWVDRSKAWVEIHVTQPPADPAWTAATDAWFAARRAKMPEPTEPEPF